MDPRESSSSTRREFLGALAVAVGSALLIGSLWLVARRAPSATRDPDMTPPVLVPTPPPPPVFIPAPATPAATPAATPVFTPVS